MAAPRNSETLEHGIGGLPLVQMQGLNTNQPVNFQGQFQMNSSGQLALFGATPVSQPSSPTGNVHTPTAGSTTSVYVNTTFDGSIGSTAYTVGDIVIALKNLGILAS